MLQTMALAMSASGYSASLSCHDREISPCGRGNVTQWNGLLLQPMSVVVGVPFCGTYAGH
jgi:hypothetical protein